MIKLLKTLILILVFGQNGSGQKLNQQSLIDNNILFNNSIYGTLGGSSNPGPGVSAALDYEHLVHNKKNIKIGAKLSFGGVAAGDETDGYGALFVTTGLNLLLGYPARDDGNFYCFEFAYGLQLIPAVLSNKYYFIGGRFHFKRYLLRLGYGVPGLYQLSFGQRF